MPAYQLEIIRGESTTTIQQLTRSLKTEQAAALSAILLVKCLEHELAQTHHDLLKSRSLEGHMHAVVVEQRSVLCDLQNRERKLVQVLKQHGIPLPTGEAGE